jgi:mannose-6-phosphate isomerase-like protein (cupin superfamily)
MPETSVLPGRLLRAAADGAVHRQRFLHSQVGLEFLDCGEHHLAPGAATEMVALPGRECLLFAWKGLAEATLETGPFELAHYDVLYVPRGCAFRLENPGPEPAAVIQCSAPAENAHPVFHARFAEYAQREERIRRLKGKDVFLMFDVGEPADKLVAGYTFFRPFQRSWPPHNHTDQEEVYFFLKGRGSMEVYESPESLSFVHNVEAGDLVTIPMLNYHPVFSQDAPLEFLWCIAGARYWVGDKHQSFMKGAGTSLTT